MDLISLVLNNPDYNIPSFVAKRFYQRLIPLADTLFDQHLETLRKNNETTKKSKGA